MTIAQTLRARQGYISLKEYAVTIGSHPQTIYKRLRAHPGSIPHVRVGGLIKFDPAVIAAFEEGRAIGNPT